MKLTPEASVPTYTSGEEIVSLALYVLSPHDTRPNASATAGTKNNFFESFINLSPRHKAILFCLPDREHFPTDVRPILPV